MTNDDTAVAVKLTKEEQAAVDAVEKLTVVQAANVAKYFEETYGIVASPVAAAVAAPAAGGEEAEAAEEKTAFDVMLKDCGAQKIAVIKVVREVSGLGLGEAKDLAEKGGKVAENVKKEEAEEMKKKFEEAGATIELA